MVEIKGRELSGNSVISLKIEAGLIISIEYSREEERNLPYLSCGFVDMQVNGYCGLDYSSDTLSQNDPNVMVSMLAESGTVKHVPTIVTSSQERIVKNLAIIAEARRRNPALRTAIPAVHIEGPYISGEDGPRGAHDPRYIRDPSLDEYREWQQASDGLVRIVTVAPERKGAIPFIEALAEDGIVPAIGHSTAGPQIIRDAVSAGAKLSTHLGNGSHPMLPRLQNYIWEQLAEDDLDAGIIADGFHLPPAVLKTFMRVKGRDRLIIVSDVAVLAGSEPGMHKWGNIDVEVEKDGHLKLAGTDLLAGAGHLLDRGIAQFVNVTAVSLEDAVRMCTVNPSREIGILPENIEKGAPANLVLFRFNPGDEKIEVEKTFREGEIIYSCNP